MSYLSPRNGKCSESIPCLRKKITEELFAPEKKEPEQYWFTRWKSSRLGNYDRASDEIQVLAATQGCRICKDLRSSQSAHARILHQGMRPLLAETYRAAFRQACSEDTTVRSFPISAGTLYKVGSLISGISSPWRESSSRMWE